MGYEKEKKGRRKPLVIQGQLTLLVNHRFGQNFPFFARSLIPLTVCVTLYIMRMPICSTTANWPRASSDAGRM